MATNTNANKSADFILNSKLFQNGRSTRTFAKYGRFVRLVARSCIAAFRPQAYYQYVFLYAIVWSTAIADA